MTTPHDPPRDGPPDQGGQYRGPPGQRGGPPPAEHDAEGQHGGPQHRAQGPYEGPQGQQGPYGAPQGQHGDPQGDYGQHAAPGQYGPAQGHGAPHGQHGAPHGQHGGAQGQAGGAQHRLGGPQGPPGAPPGYGDIPPGQGGGAPQPGQHRSSRAGQYSGPPPPGPPDLRVPGPYGGPPADSAFAYNPYGSPYPTGGNDSKPAVVKRPGIMILSLVLLILSALPWLLLGVVLLVGATNASKVLPGSTGILADLVTAIRDARLDPVTVLRSVGGVFVVPALLLVLLAVVAFRGSNIGRIGVTVLTALITIALVVGLVFSVSGASARGLSLTIDVGSMAIAFGPPLVAIIGVVLLFLPGPRRYFRGPRR